jgi:hypothetical protein
MHLTLGNRDGLDAEFSIENSASVKDRAIIYEKEIL